LLHSKLAEVLETIRAPSEIIFVNDGSTDGTVQALRELQTTDPRVTVIDLRRNFGHHPATYAGFDHASGDIVVTLDGDLQNDPADIPRLLKKMEEGYDIVCGWRTDRKDPLLTRRLPSIVVNRLISHNAGTQVHDYGCFLRAYKNFAAKEIASYATVKGWFPVLFGNLGFRVGEVKVQHHPRPGKEKSHHNFFMRLDQFMSVFMGVTTRPFQIVEFLGIGFMAVGFLGILSCLGYLVIQGQLPAILLCLLTVNFFLLGFLTLVIGLVGEYVVRMNYEVGNKPKYLVREIIRSAAHDSKEHP
jgi:glycosyltransferase involved in cell wall biosynthesis